MEMKQYIQYICFPYQQEVRLFSRSFKKTERLKKGLKD